MLLPKRVKYRKVQKGKMRGLSYRGSKVSFGDFALQATECGRMTARQIEAARIAMTRYIKRQGKVWIRVSICLLQLPHLFQQGSRVVFRCRIFLVLGRMSEDFQGAAPGAQAGSTREISSVWTESFRQNCCSGGFVQECHC